jgi:hypothetical protein
MKHTADTLRNVDARSEGDTAGDDDGGGAGRERDAGVVGGRGGLERDASTEPSGDRVGFGYGARCEHGACDVHGNNGLIATVYPEVYPSDMPPILARLEPSHVYIRPH